MLPGAAPPVKEPEPVEIGFDVPAEAKTLSSANKVGIAHIGQKRGTTAKIGTMNRTLVDQDYKSKIYIISFQEKFLYPRLILYIKIGAREPYYATWKTVTE